MEFRFVRKALFPSVGRVGVVSCGVVGSSGFGVSGSTGVCGTAGSVGLCEFPVELLLLVVPLLELSLFELLPVDGVT